MQAGGGWVNDSTPEGEYQETVNKAKAMLKAVAMAESFREMSAAEGTRRGEKSIVLWLVKIYVWLRIE